MGLKIRDQPDSELVTYEDLEEGVWYSVNYPQYVVLVDRDLKKVIVDKKYGCLYGPGESKGVLPDLSPLKKASPITFYNKD